MNPDAYINSLNEPEDVKASLREYGSMNIFVAEVNRMAFMDCVILERAVEIVIDKRLMELKEKMKPKDAKHFPAESSYTFNGLPVSLEMFVGLAKEMIESRDEPEDAESDENI